jgi:hypothetical protein
VFLFPPFPLLPRPVVSLCCVRFGGEALQGRDVQRASQAAASSSGSSHSSGSPLVMSTGGAAGSSAPSDALVKGVSDLATNNAYFDGLVGWFQTQIAAAPPNTSLGQHNNTGSTHKHRCGMYCIARRTRGA